MRVLFLAHGFNSLTQRLFVELRGRGHEVSIELDIADSVVEEAVEMWRPDVIVAPYLRRAIPERVWARHVCLVVHPGIVGDRGPSALDWAIQEGEREWGVTVLQANGVMDAGPVWAAETFAMRAGGAPPTKSSLYRNEVTEAAVRAVTAALDRVASGSFRPRDVPAAEGPAAHGQDASVRGRARPLMRQEDRAIDWLRDDTLTVLRRIAAADGFPGVRDALFGAPCFLHDARAEPGAASGGPPGELLARGEGGVLRATRDGAIWIGHVRRPDHLHPFKLPVALAYASEVADLALALAVAGAGDGDPVRYDEEGAVGYLRFDFYNGAMSTRSCERLRAAVLEARRRPTRVLVLMGGEDFWSNGLHLNVIEAADSPADESMRNIVAMDDLALAILDAGGGGEGGQGGDQLTVSALSGNAGAGGAFLALAADEVWARCGVILNPHYKSMGNLYGSEYWTYSLPRRVGEERARAIVENRLPIDAGQAARTGLVDACFGEGLAAFRAEVRARAAALAGSPGLPARLAARQKRRRQEERLRPLAAYREAELREMQRNFYGFDPSYHYARHHFVHKVPLAWTPRHLALHRELTPAPARR